MAPPFRLDLPERAGKPRRVGLTHVLDKGMPPAQAADALAACGPYVDVWKFGWGTAYVDRGIGAKLELLRDHTILGCVGGTLLEVAWAQDRVDEYLSWASDQGFPCIEVSRGAVPMSLEDKHGLIRRAAAEFVVLSEVGSKNAAERAPSRAWAEEVAADLRAGAAWVLTEGRESGTVGIYDETGEVRRDVVAAVADAGGVDFVVFEAPSKDQQAWFIRRFGPNVNLANIVVTEVLGLETLRLGLRADTMGLSCPVPTVRR
ncbi:MAG: phosphosulfolactate synthase [Actinomycetota bacterium]|nr:phosphosulfolactate synthase [Actinomycetota bacterium]